MQQKQNAKGKGNSINAEGVAKITTCILLASILLLNVHTTNQGAQHPQTSVWHAVSWATGVDSVQIYHTTNKTSHQDKIIILLHSSLTGLSSLRKVWILRIVNTLTFQIYTKNQMIMNILMEQIFLL